MKETPNTAKEHKEIPAGTFNMRIGGTTYVVCVHFSKESKDTLEDKVKRLMRDDVLSVILPFSILTKLFRRVRCWWSAAKCLKRAAMSSSR